MLTQKQAALFWRSLAAAADRQAVPDREAYRKRILREECGVEHLGDVDRTEGFDRLMLRLAQDAEDWHALAYYSVAGERRLADLVADCATQVLDLSSQLGVHPVAYISGILRQSGMSPLRTMDGDYWMDLAPSDLVRLLQILDTYRRRLIKRGDPARIMPLAFVHGRRWFITTTGTIDFKDPPGTSPAFRVNILSA